MAFDDLAGSMELTCWWFEVDASYLNHLMMYIKVSSSVPEWQAFNFSFFRMA